MPSIEKNGLYAGSFDPMTNGHLEIVTRAAKLFSRVWVLVTTNTRKSYMFSSIERRDIFREHTKHLPNVHVREGGGLTVEAARSLNCAYLIRGLRTVGDAEAELIMASANRMLGSDIDTVWFSTDQLYVSSSNVKEVLLSEGTTEQLTKFVPEDVAKLLVENRNKNEKNELSE